MKTYIHAATELIFLYDCKIVQSNYVMGLSSSTFYVLIIALYKILYIWEGDGIYCKAEVDNVFQGVAISWCWWFSPGTPVSSINKIDSHDITEILLKVELNTITLTLNHILRADWHLKSHFAVHVWLIPRYYNHVMLVTEPYSMFPSIILFVQNNLLPFRFFFFFLYLNSVNC